MMVMAEKREKKKNAKRKKQISKNMIMIIGMSKSFGVRIFCFLCVSRMNSLLMRL